MRFVTGIVLTLVVGCAARTPSSPALHPAANEVKSASASRSAGYVLQPHEGEPLIFCDAPEISANIKVSPATTGDAAFAMGTAELTGSNSGTHRTEDEIIYFLSGTGSAFVGERHVRIQPGVTMYVPRGVKHGFKNEGAEPVRFVWVVAPTGLEERFRAGGRRPGFDCSSLTEK